MKDPLERICSELARDPKKARKRARALSPFENTAMEAVRDAVAMAEYRNGSNEWEAVAIYLQEKHQGIWRELLGIMMEKANAYDRARLRGSLDAKQDVGLSGLDETMLAYLLNPSNKRSVYKMAAKLLEGGTKTLPQLMLELGINPDEELENQQEDS